MLKVIVRVVFGLVLAYGAVALILAGVLPQTLHATPMWYGQVFGAIVVGLGGLGATFLNGLPQLHWPVSIPKKTEGEEDIPLSPSKIEETDMRNLYYLSARARSFKDDEALKLLKHLERRFWCKHHGITPDKVIKSDEKTSTESKS